jgi:hypothetical protein
MSVRFTISFIALAMITALVFASQKPKNLSIFGPESDNLFAYRSPECTVTNRGLVPKNFECFLPNLVIEQKMESTKTFAETSYQFITVSAPHALDQTDVRIKLLTPITDKLSAGVTGEFVSKASNRQDFIYGPELSWTLDEHLKINSRATVWGMNNPNKYTLEMVFTLK